jgi:hypothetical protein
MTIIFGILALVCVVLMIALFLANKNLTARANEAEQQVDNMRAHYESETQRVHAEAEQQVGNMRAHYESETQRVYAQAQAALAESQKLVNQESEELKRESARVRQHYLDEARKIQSASSAMVKRILKEVEPLRRYQGLGNAEAEVKRQLAQALEEATALRAESKALLDSTRAASRDERTQASQRAKEIHEQADARLDQAIRDAGRILAEAEKRAQDIGGEAYTALRDHQMLEQAAHAMRNIVDGYGDRYLVPTHSLLDDLAAEYGYEAAGRSLASAREQAKRMVEQGAAAECDYAEPNRRATAIRFVIHAFNGSVDSILSRTKSDNYGILEQRIRDVFSIVNRDGAAFRNAHILPIYLDARLSELKWAVVVQELVARDREEQRYLKEQERDRLKAEQERLTQLREVEKEKEIKRTALAEAESRLAQAHAEERAKLEQEVQQLRQEVLDATRRELTIAQQTNKGCVYIISNIGSFGEGVYKIGLTRRQAHERVDELSGASVPFEFDIHAVIETENAPALEYKIHQQFLPMRMNKINLRKEFFRASMEEIRKRIDGLEQGKDYRGTVTWTEKAKAQQYYDSLDIERDAVAREKWLNRTRILAERRHSSPVAISAAEVSDMAADLAIDDVTTPRSTEVGNGHGSPLPSETVIEG